jgi:hypothetical protein
VTTPVFLTVDVALRWTLHAAGLDRDAVIERSFEPAGVGLSWQLAMLAQHELKGCFFVDPLPALVFGLDPIRRVVDTILDAGQEVQLRLDPAWGGAVAGDDGATHGRFALSDYATGAQHALIAGARELLVAAGAPAPLAFRAHRHAANDATLEALTALGFAYDTSRNGSERNDDITLPPRQIAPVARGGVVELPVTLIEEQGAALRPFALSALSAGEICAALDHAEAFHHAAVTIVSAADMLANRAGTRPNAIHVGRFTALCGTLSERRDTLPTCWFGDRPMLRLGQEDRPLEPHRLRSGWRQAEQLWSHLVEERAA